MNCQLIYQNKINSSNFVEFHQIFLHTKGYKENKQKVILSFSLCQGDININTYQNIISFTCEAVIAQVMILLIKIFSYSCLDHMHVNFDIVKFIQLVE